jgi:hypothetical protein
LYGGSTVVGRITEKHLFEAEKTFPGIVEMYEELAHKPATFLQLVWIYEATVATEAASLALA